VFSNTVRAENLCSKNMEVYNACPFCLTEIPIEKESLIEESKSAKKENTESKQAVMHPSGKIAVEQSPKARSCAHHLGYLSKRSSKEKIPEECMVCENIVQCMLKNVTG